MGNWLQGKGFPEPAKSPAGRRRGRSPAPRRGGAEETFNFANGKQTGITEREREVLTWAARGLSSRDTGMVLDIAKRTVDEHLQTAARKLGAANKTQAVAIAIRDRLIEVDPP
jgi:DNA-binding CsgD family transcriptional regulator